MKNSHESIVNEGGMSYKSGTEREKINSPLASTEVSSAYDLLLKTIQLALSDAEKLSGIKPLKN